MNSIGDLIFPAIRAESIYISETFSVKLMTTCLLNEIIIGAVLVIKAESALSNGSIRVAAF